MIDYLPLNKINARYLKEFHSSLFDVINEDTLILGEAVSKFEQEFANYCSTDFCIGVGSGFDALKLILEGYVKLGLLKIGDGVIVPSNTFVATALAVIQAGLKPIFVDPNPDTFNLEAETIEPFISKAKAIIPVHLYGQLCEMSSLMALARSNNILVIEDAAQAHGAEDKEGRKAGSFGNAAAFSFYPTKNLGCLGDGGAITTNDEDLAKVLLQLRNYGKDGKYYVTNGINSRLDTLQASFLSIKLKELDRQNDTRRHYANLYSNKIVDPKIKLPKLKLLKAHVFYAYVIRVDNRQLFIRHLQRYDIGFNIHYPKLLPEEHIFKDFVNNDLQTSLYINSNIISLPLHPLLSELDVTTIIETVNSY